MGLGLGQRQRRTSRVAATAGVLAAWRKTVIGRRRGGEPAMVAGGSSLLRSLR